MKQPKKIKREHKIEISKLRPELDLAKYNLVSVDDNEYILIESDERNKERSFVVIPR
jgi:hypothetical protein